METTVDPAAKLDWSLSKRRPVLGLALSGLGAAFLLFDSVIKLVKIQPVVESFAQLGYPEQAARGVGLLELCCLALYLVPRTAALGAVLLTGFLGGAISTHLRVGDPWLSHTLFPLYVAAFVWGGLALRDPRPSLLWAAPNRRNP
jgi:hypothetical protein